jgi:hypothetical protein
MISAGRETAMQFGDLTAGVAELGATLREGNVVVLPSLPCVCGVTVLVVDDGVAEDAESIDLDLDDVAGVQRPGGVQA